MSPVELETILCSHPSVIDAAVVRGGIAGEEHPVAFVVPGTDFDARVLGDWFREQVAPYKRIDDIRCVDAIPGTPQASCYAVNWSARSLRCGSDYRWAQKQTIPHLHVRR